MIPTEFYHGTSLQAAINIQQRGFDVSLSGSNAALGKGVYITTTLEKALNYAKPKPHGGVIFKLRVDLGNCLTLVKGDPLMKTWADNGYDSAYAPTGVIGEREESCVRSPKRIEIVDVILGITSKANQAGFFVKGGQLVEDHKYRQQRKVEQERKRQEERRRQEDDRRKQEDERRTLVDPHIPNSPSTPQINRRAVMYIIAGVGVAIAVTIISLLYLAASNEPELEQQWTALPDMPTARRLLAASIYDGVLYAVGGYPAPSTLEAYII
eukprot:SAG11_NODE_7008_length_1209_cov_1.750450_2_plen_268_part_00